MSGRFDETGLTLPWDTVPPIDPKEFHSAYMLYVNAAARRVLIQNPAKREPILHEEEDNTIGVYHLTDNPVSRGLTALSNRYQEDHQQYHAISHRIYALTNLIGTKTLKGWCKRIAGGYDVHDAVIDAAAVVMMTKDGEFPPDTFLREVAKIAKENYSGE